jgi:hypothetical protein
MATVTYEPTSARRWGAGTAAITRLLIAADQPLTGVAIAAEVGVSQPRVSQVIAALAQHAAVSSTNDGYVGRAETLLELYRWRARPVLVEPEACWYSLRSPGEQISRLVESARSFGVSVAVSADLAPDLLVPWRHPTVTIVYAAAPLPLDDAGFVRAEARVDASVLVRLTNDPTLLRPSTPWPKGIDGVPLTDPVQQWFDLLDLGGEDRDEAAERLRRAIVDRTVPGRG